MSTWLETIGREFVGAQTDTDVYQALLSAADHLIDADEWTVATAEDNTLRPQASTQPNGDCILADTTVGTMLLGTVNTEDKPCLIDDLTDVRSAASTANQQNEPADHQTTGSAYRSLLAVPMATSGILIAAAHDPGEFTEADRDLAVNLATYAAAALDRTRATPTTEPDRLDEIASILSHDLKTPLQVARGRLELAEATGETDHFAQVETALDRIETLADDLAMLARTNERIGTLKPVDLQDLVNSAWVTVANPRSTVELEDSTTILADDSTVCQLLENLFSNAIDHAGPDVEIRVGTLESGFYVEDDGPGIPPDKRDQVFEWRTSSGSEHTGLGLAIVERIAEAHGWEITITGGESGGARFEITNVDIDV